jgi:hypothetical protein
LADISLALDSFLADISLLAPAIKPNPTTAEPDLSSER